MLIQATQKIINKVLISAAFRQKNWDDLKSNINGKIYQWEKALNKLVFRENIKSKYWKRSAENRKLRTKIAGSKFRIINKHYKIE